MKSRKMLAAMIVLATAALLAIQSPAWAAAALSSQGYACADVSADTDVLPGDTVTCTLTLKNIGDATATGVTATGTTPSNTTAVTGNTLSGPSSLAAGATADYTASFTINNSAAPGSSLQSTATFQATGIAPGQASSNTLTVSPYADLLAAAATTQPATTVHPLDSFEQDFIVTNGGPSDSTAMVTAAGTTSSPAGTVAPTAVQWQRLSGGVPSGSVTSCGNTGPCTGGSAIPLTSGDSALVKLSFTAPHATSVSGTITVAPEAGAPVQPRRNNTAGDSATVTTTITTPVQAVSITPSSLSFGTQQVGTSAIRTVTVANTGDTPITVNSFSATGDYAAASSGTCTPGSSITVGASCTIDVAFTPTAPGIRSGVLTISDSASDSPQQVALSGTGFLEADLALSMG
ncbi:MAG: choice-of-anchor D domain-containing protein, partial [Actinobacteria bacterium]|nr:choice-of-anchor D domain-containing protein [Actinomycetota bacterium]